MKRTKRQENAIVISFSSFAISFIVFLLIGVFYIYPEIIDIEVKKQETLEVYNDFKKLEKTGLSFNDFKSKIKTFKLQELDKKGEGLNVNYVKGILNEIDKNFYEDNFKNTTSGDYDNFIFSLKDKYKNNKDLDEKFKIVSKILPSYSENIYEIDKDSLTDFKFINYIESLVYNFNLLYKDSIGINGLTLLPNYSVLSSDGSLDKNIYYINLDLNLTGKKSSILDFIYYLENVGMVKVDENGELEVISKEFTPGEDFYNFKFKNLLDKDDNIPNNYNIFDNQIIEIQNMNFSEDIDSSFDPTISIGNNSLIYYLKKTNQMDEKFEVKLSLRFYVKGLPKYKIENFINDFVEKYKKIDKELSKDLKNVKIKSTDKRKLESIYTTLKSFDSFIKNLNKSKKKGELTNIYNECYKYNKFLDEQINKINEIKINYIEDKKKVEKQNGDDVRGGLKNHQSIKNN